MKVTYLLIFILSTCVLSACKTPINQGSVQLTHGIDESAGGDPAYIIQTPAAIYYLEKQGGGLSSLVDVDGVDWLGFNKREGSGWKGEFRGFPNAIHQQDGNYFHAMNAKTEPSSSKVTIEQDDHVQIVFTSGNGKWQGQWDFFPDRLDFTMAKVSPGYHYWIQYEGVPGGEMDNEDFWYASADAVKHPITEHFIGDLPYPEWIAFGDASFPRMLFMLHHEDDDLPDNYESRPYMTVFAFGRSQKNKFIETPQTFSIGFVESTEYEQVSQSMKKLINRP